MNGAAGGVTAKQSALRAFQHFDTFDVSQRDFSTSTTAGVYAINVYGHCRVGTHGEVTGFDAAHAIRGLQRGVVVHFNARGEFTQVGEVLDAHRLHAVASKGRDGNWNVLEVFRTFLCGYNNLFNLGRVCSAA